MAKPRSDSLYENLARAGLLDEFFVMFYTQRPGYKEIAEWLDKAGMPNSDGAIHTLLHVHSLYWKIEQADRRAAATADTLPENTDEMIRRQLKQKEFDLAFAEMGTKEALAVLRFDLDKRSAEFAAALEQEKLKLKREAEARASGSLRLAREKFEAAEARLNAARDAMARLDASGGLSAEARAEIEKAMGIL